MTETAWAQGMAVLVASLADRELTPEMASIRGASYREDLAHLTDAEWWYAVKAARRSLQFFPSIKDLLDFASEAPAETRPVLSAPECQWCEGYGFEYVDSDYGTTIFVRRCRCRPPLQNEAHA